MRIYLGADHNGFAYKQKIKEFLQRAGHEVIDEGDTQLQPGDDFPVYAGKTAQALLGDSPEARGILICGSGQGVAMAANRFKGIRAALCWNLAEARCSRNDDDCNVLCLSATNTSLQDAESIITTFLSTPFAGAERFKRRIKELDNLG